MLSKLWLSKTTTEIRGGETIVISPAVLLVRAGVIKKCATWHLEGIKDGYCISVTPDNYSPTPQQRSKFNIIPIASVDKIIEKITANPVLQAKLQPQIPNVLRTKQINFDKKVVDKELLDDWSDNFNDNNLNLDAWATCLTGGSAVAEQNQRLETDAQAVGGVSGIVSNDSHDLSDKYGEIDFTFDEATGGSERFYFCLTKVTASDPNGEADWYRIEGGFGPGNYSVDKKIGGVATNNLYTEVVSPLAVQRIAIAGANILFYLGGVQKYSEANGLPSNVGYFYISGTAAGADCDRYFDDFVTDTDGWPSFPPGLPPAVARVGMGL